MKKSPVKQKSQPPHLHNYCNVSPLLGDVINKKSQLIFSKVQPEQVFNCLNNKNENHQKNHLYENTAPVFSENDYLPMGPDSLDDLPIRPFDPMDYSQKNMEPIGKKSYVIEDVIWGQWSSGTS